MLTVQSSTVPLPRNFIGIRTLPVKDGTIAPSVADTIITGVATEITTEVAAQRILTEIAIIAETVSTPGSRANTVNHSQRRRRRSRKSKITDRIMNLHSPNLLINLFVRDDG